MQSVNIVRESNVVRTPRVMQIEGIFDVAPADKSAESWDVSLPIDDKPWNIGLIIGPSGCGKSTIANEIFSDSVFNGFEWDTDRSIVDGFPQDMSIKDITELLSKVGFSSPPLWLRPYRVLSTGQKMRVDIARLLAKNLPIAVMDEFTSVVDRNVAQIGSAAISKAVRKRGQKFVAVTCHYDVIEWLQPDWVYQPHTDDFLWRFPERFPKIELDIRRVHSSAWRIFRQYHYLDNNLNRAARCFCAFYKNVPVAFTAVLHLPHASSKMMKREHRTVCLPDYQGVGIGNALSDFVASHYTSSGYRYFSQTSSPAMIFSRNRSDKWIMRQAPTYKKSRGGSNCARRSWASIPRKRNVASFEYIG